MRRPGVRLVSLLLFVIRLTSSAISQTSPPQTQPSQSSTGNSSAPAATFHATTRMVTLEVVAKDSKGHHVGGLNASDFQIFEQVPSRGKEKHEQKIAVFREVRVANLAKQTNSETQIPTGVYTNLVALQEDPVPPTILLVDGLNTDLQHQMQVHRQMLKMLRSLPSNVPAAVFLFGHRLRMLQDFTTDPSLLQAALEKATSTAGVGAATIDPRDNPGEISAQMEKMNGGSRRAHASPEVIEALRNFEQEVYAGDMDMRVYRTIDALSSIARHVAGYPGRKNLLWISTAFPIYLKPFDYKKYAGYRNYWEQLQRLNGVLSDAKVSVYPISPAGVQTSVLFEAGTIPRDISGQGVGDTLSRETMARANEQDTMQTLAEGTGGKVCTGDNDLGDCVRKAVDDSSEFYEIAYYPDSPNWNGEYRAITVKAPRPGLHLAYRRGYYARLEGRENAKDQISELRQAACDDYLNATSIFFAAKSLPPDSPEKLKFYLMISLGALTLNPTSAGGRDLNIAVAVCTFDKKGGPRQLMSDPIHRQFTAKEYESLTAAGGFSHIVSIPGPKPAAVRLLVKDVPSGRLGSIRIETDDGAIAPSTAAGNGVQQPASAQ